MDGALNFVMIYEEKSLKYKLSRQFFYFCEFFRRNIRLRKKKILKKKQEEKAKAEVRKKRTKNQFANVDRHPDYWSSAWDDLIKRFLSAIEGGVSIDSREGKLFRRRFRVPWQVCCEKFRFMVDQPYP